jgi:hypothetical protein
MNKNIKISIIISILIIGLIRFYPILERTPGGHWNILLNLSIGTLFVWIIIKIFKEIYRLIKLKHRINFKELIPIFILIISFLDINFNFFKIDLDSIYGKIEKTAYYSGTQNQAVFNLRDNGNFEIHWTGVFFSDDFYTGIYEKKGDSIFLDFETEIPRRFGKTLIIKDLGFFTIENDSLIPTYFYLAKKFKDKND